MKNFIPMLICLLALFFVAFKDGTFNVFSPQSWYDIIGCLSVIGVIISTFWGLYQQQEDNNLRRLNTRKDVQKRVLAGYQPSQNKKPDAKPLAPPKSK